MKNIENYERLNEDLKLENEHYKNEMISIKEDNFALKKVITYYLI